MSPKRSKHKSGHRRNQLRRTPDRPPLILLVHCRKCDQTWSSHMKLVKEPPSLGAQGPRRGRYHPRHVWIFPPSSFEHCKACGASNQGGEERIIECRTARLDGKGRIRLRLVRTEETIDDAQAI